MTLLLASSCLRVDNSAELRAADSTAPVTANCFTKLLVSGPAKDGTISDVVFAHGVCRNNVNAIDKMVHASSVQIIDDGVNQTAKLFLVGGNVTANVAGKQVKIGSISSNPADLDVNLVEGADVKLYYQSGGQYVAWTSADGMAAKSGEQIRIYLK